MIVTVSKSEVHIVCSNDEYKAICHSVLRDMVDYHSCDCDWCKMILKIEATIRESYGHNEKFVKD